MEMNNCTKIEIMELYGLWTHQEMNQITAPLTQITTESEINSEKMFYETRNRKDLFSFES